MYTIGNLQLDGAYLDHLTRIMYLHYLVKMQITILLIFYTFTTITTLPPEKKYLLLDRINVSK